jgi:hypothetical protein
MDVQNDGALGMNDRAARAPRILPFVAAHRPELVLVGLGIVLRLTMRTRFAPSGGFDFAAHWRYIEWVARHGTIPDLRTNYISYHAPLYYFLAGGLRHLGLGSPGLATVSALFGVARLLLVWWGLELYVPERRPARLIALATLAVLPSSIHIDGMVSNEPLNNALSALALVLAPRAVAAEGATARRRMAALGVVVGLAVLTKISAVLIVGAVGAGWACVWLRGVTAGSAPQAGHRRLGARLAPLLVFVAVVGCVSGWFYTYQRIRYGVWAPTAYNGAGSAAQARFQGIPYLRRRPAPYFVGWSADVARDPYYPSGSAPASRFWPVLVASTFVDYWSHSFAPVPRDGNPRVLRNGRAIPPGAVGTARLAFLGGTVMAVVTGLAWLIVAWRLPRRRDARLVPVLAAALAVAGQLHYAVSFPADDWGPVKGAYLQFAAPAFFALFGIAADALGRRPCTRPLAVACVLALALVAGYTLYCRGFAVLDLG